MNYLKDFKLYEQIYKCDPEKCIYRNQYDNLEEWLKNGGDANFRSNTSQYYLSIAAKKSNSDIAELLLKYGANPDKQNNNGYSALMYAVIENSIAVVKLLIGSNANLNFETTTKHYTALIYAASMKRYNILNQLLDAGADWTYLDKNGKSFLDKLIVSKREKIIQTYPEKYQHYLKFKGYQQKANKFKI